MTLSDHEQRQLDEIELGLARDHRSAPRRTGHRSRWTTATRLFVGALVLIVALVLTFSEADGLTFLIAGGLLGTIVYLHRYNANNS